MNTKHDIIFTNEKGSTRVAGSEVEFNQLVVDPQWGQNRLNSELYRKLAIPKKVLVKKGTTLMDADGKRTIAEEDTILDLEEFLWSELNFYTQDFGLGNLDRGEKIICRHYTLLAADFLRKGMYEAFIVALNRTIVTLELSQSTGGFLRKWFGTIRKLEGPDEPSKPRLPFGGTTK